jgi:hypothetical protein
VDFVFSQPSEVPTGWTNSAVRMILGMQATLLPLSGTLFHPFPDFAF